MLLNVLQRRGWPTVKNHWPQMSAVPGLRNADQSSPVLLPLQSELRGLIKLYAPDLCSLLLPQLLLQTFFLFLDLLTSPPISQSEERPRGGQGRPPPNFPSAQPTLPPPLTALAHFSSLPGHPDTLQTPTRSPDCMCYSCRIQT